MAVKIKPVRQAETNDIGKFLRAGEITAAFNEAVNRDIAEKRENGLPVALYDPETERAYLENPDGTREYV